MVKLIDSLNCWSNKCIAEKAAEVPANKVLHKCSNVKVLEINDCIAGRPEEEALKTLSTLCNSSIICSLCWLITVVEVNVSDNALGVKGVNTQKCVDWEYSGTHLTLFLYVCVTYDMYVYVYIHTMYTV